MSNYGGLRTTTITQRMMTKVINGKGDMKKAACKKCKNELFLGDIIVTKRCAKFNWYHESCAKLINLI